jgi:hypothetical protein
MMDSKSHSRKKKSMSSGPESSQTRELQTHPTQNAEPGFLPMEWSSDYVKARDMILLQLGSYAGLESYWLEFGFVKKDGIASAVILVDIKERHRRIQMERELMECLSAIPSTLQVKVVYGTVGLAAGDPKSPDNPYRYQSVVPGCSIGPAGANWSGSLGVFLKKVPDDGKRYALTCAHTFCENDCSDKTLSFEDLQTILPNGTEVVQPSDPDNNYLKQSIGNELQKNEIKINRLLSEISMTEDSMDREVLE